VSFHRTEVIEFLTTSTQASYNINARTEERLSNDWRIDLSKSDSGKHVAEEDWRTGLLFGEKKRSCVISSIGSHRPTVKINARMEKRLSNNWQIDLSKSGSGKHVAEEDWRTVP